MVVSANFLIDAESNLKAALSGFHAADAARRRAKPNDRAPHPLVGHEPVPDPDRLRCWRSAAGIYAVRHVPLDAMPDLSDTQVIVYTEYSGQAPQVIEDQVTYPLSTAMLSVPRSKVVRGFSFFGVSFVYVIFEDGTDIYWARSRVLEYLSCRGAQSAGRRDADAGPDATGVGWVYQYAVMAAKRHAGRAALDAGLAGALCASPRPKAWPRSPASAASCGSTPSSSIRAGSRPSTSRCRRCATPSAQSNMDVGGRVVELAETEFMVRGRGYLRGIERHRADRAQSRRRHARAAADVARVELAPDERRGVTELNGEGEVVSGIAVQRYGQNALVGHRERQGAPRRDQGQPAGRHRDHSGL